MYMAHVILRSLRRLLELVGHMCGKFSGEDELRGAESSHSAGAVMGCGACLPRCGRADTKQTEKIALRVRAKSYLGRRAVWV